MAKDSLSRACMDRDLVQKYKWKHGEVPISGILRTRQDAGFHLESDGSVLKDNSSGCGGMLRLQEVVEIFGIFYGLQMCWDRGIRDIVVHSDCLEAINLLIRGYNLDHPFRDLIEETRLLLHRDWQVYLSYTPISNLTLVDFLAKSSHTMEGSFRILDQPPIVNSGIVHE
ncbi:uncharacterized protein LOC114739897 [Neltuma alba]|uniref:uncharacterized protein LOC114739897 n=1 Tax=Neltuma alba TaxID=207710 RepID=UPI0010A51132|nr:uncharacterized protein LOC114739897 [Prosopis alba]